MTSMMPQLDELRYPIRSGTIISIPSRETAAPLVVRARSVLILVVGSGLGLRLFGETGSFAL